MTETGADVVARTLAARGVDTIFTVSGNQVLPLIDALGRLGLRMIHMRHETAAVYAAIGAAEMTGGPSAALVSAGPGFLAALQGIGVAASMELPVVLLSGSPASTALDGAFQALDQHGVAGALGVESLHLGRPERVEPTVMSAIERARSGVPGPAHLRLPVDLLESPAYSGVEPPAQENQAVWRFDERVPERLNEMAELLSRAERPAILARPSAGRSDLLWKLAGRLGIDPIVVESPRGVSDLKYAEMNAALKDADCLLAIAPADFAVGFLGEAFIGKPRDLLVIDAPGEPAPARLDYLHARTASVLALRYLLGRVERPRDVEEGWAATMRVQPPHPVPDPVDGLPHPLAVAATVRARLRPDDVVVLDGGEFCQWVRLGLRDIPNRVLWNGKLGAIGGSIPMALGVAATRPGARVFAILGDGSAGYHLSEFETAAREGLSFIALIGNDARWAAEWHMQVGRYGDDRAYATELTPARYEVAADGFGGVGFAAGSMDEMARALDAALASGKAACINVRVASVRSPAIVH